MMKINDFRAAVFALISLAVVSCSQDPIFFTISQETKPIKPLIDGSPTNMVVFKRDYPGNPAVPILYVASGRIYWYAKGANGTGWNLSEYYIPPRPGGNVGGLAATKNYLYAFCSTGHGVGTAVYRIRKDEEEWKPVGIAGNYSIQTIYADPDTNWLFAGARTGDRYAVLYMDDDDPPRLNVLGMVSNGTTRLTGAAFDGTRYYLSTYGSGFFKVDGNTAVRLSRDVVDGSDNNLKFTGMYKIKNEKLGIERIIAVEREDGTLFEIDNDTFKQLRDSNDRIMKGGKLATGAIDLWVGLPGGSRAVGDNLLVLGIQGGLYNTTRTSYTYGYVEFLYDETGDSFTQVDRLSVINPDRYTATIGKRSINHLFQVPPEIDDAMPYFASTQTSGLWSYRDRPGNGGWQWNAEN